MRHRKTTKGAVLLTLFILMGATFCTSAAAYDPDTIGFPDYLTDSGRFINVTRGMSSLGDTGAGQDTLNLSLQVLPALDQFKLLVFDGDMGGQWDMPGCNNPDDITFKLYLDPNAIGNTHSDDLIWEWPAKLMEDNKWCYLLPGNNPANKKGTLQCENGAPPTEFIVNDNAAFNAARGQNIYHLVAAWDTTECANEQNNFKVAVQGTPFILAGSTIGFEGLDYNPVHPNPGTPVLYDGSFSFLVYIPQAVDRVTLWDGDLDVKDDGDDWDSPAKPPFQHSPLTENQGINPGDPADDSSSAYALVPPNVNYTFSSPGFWDANNPNPSGDQEWEEFDIVTAAGGSGDVTVTSIPANFYVWQIDGLDLFNTAFIHANFDIYPNNGALGDYIWNDADQDGVQDATEVGIQGVTVNLWFNGGIVATRITDANGFYLFNIFTPGDYTVKVDSSNFAPGGALEGWQASPANQGGNDLQDSDGDPATHDFVVTMAQAETNRTVDFGFYYDTECGPCDGKVTQLTLQYTGALTPADVRVESKDGDVFNGPVNPGDLFTFVGKDKKGTLGTEIKVYVDGDENTAIHTSCSKDIGPGMTFGDFYVVQGYSRNGGLLCPEENFPCSVESVKSKLKGNKLEWEIENTGTGTVTIESIDITWPDGAGGLKKIKFNGDIFKPKKPAPPTNFFIESGWNGDEKDRQLKKGKKKALKFEFEEDIPSGELFVTVTFAEGDDCMLELYIPETPGGDFECAKPLDALTMIWAGSPADVEVTAWAGEAGDDPMLAERVLVSNGGEITVAGYAGVDHPNDVIWEIFDAATGDKIGESVFHLSCSDDDMDGPEDCGNWEGDGKGNDTDFINTWVLQGMTDSNGSFVCP